MKTITVLEDRKNRVKSANSLLPSLLTDEELNQISGGVGNTCSDQVICGHDYTLGTCAMRLHCGRNYTEPGGLGCKRGYDVMIPIPPPQTVE